MIDKFDDLARSLAAPSTRRQLLKKFTIGLTATALACMGLVSKAKADPGRCKTYGERCHYPIDCCSGNCWLVRDSKYKGGNPQGYCV